MAWLAVLAAFDATTAVVAVAVALIAAAGTVCSPLLLAARLEKQAAKRKIKDDEARKNERIADLERQEAIRVEVANAAVQTREAAELLVVAQRKRDLRLDEVAKAAAAAAEVNSAKLDGIDRQARAIHTLVNQKLTAALQRALVATVGLLEQTEEIIARQRQTGDSDPATLKRADAARQTITELKQELDDREDAQDRVDADDQAADTPDS